MQRLRVTSESLRSVGYDADSRTLEAEFHNDHVYQYLDVPAFLWEELTKAASMGAYFNENIRDRYPTRQIR